MLAERLSEGPKEASIGGQGTAPWPPPPGTVCAPCPCPESLQVPLTFVAHLLPGGNGCCLPYRPPPRKQCVHLCP